MANCRVLALTGAIALLTFGCEGPTGNPLPQGDWRGSSDAVLSSLTDERSDAYELRAAGERGRFEDAPLACYWAIAEDGVEMGLGQTIATPKKQALYDQYDRYVFLLKTVEGWPATLTVDRAPGERVRRRELVVVVGRDLENGALWQAGSRDRL